MGKSYLDVATNYHKSSGKFYSTIEGGTKVALPRYYRDKIWPKEDRSENTLDAKFEAKIKATEFRLKKIRERDKKFKLSGEDPGLHDRMSKEQLQNNFISKIKRGNKL